MPRYGVLENFPLQLLSYEDLKAILAEVVPSSPRKWSTPRAEEEWGRLCGEVQEALHDAYLLGPAAKGKWLHPVADHLARIDRHYTAPEATEIRIAYLSLLDRVYGATLRHVLRRMPTALCSASGHFRVSRLLMFRYSRIRETEEKPALEELMEFLYLGGPRFEMEWSWSPLGSEIEEEEDEEVMERRRRRRE